MREYGTFIYDPQLSNKQAEHQLSFTLKSTVNPPLRKVKLNYQDHGPNIFPSVRVLVTYYISLNKRRKIFQFDPERKSRK